MSELEFVAWLRERMRAESSDRVPLGDDAAVLDWAAHPDCVVATDLLADGVHFVLSEAGAARVGRKALAVNLSDLAAMAAIPVAAVVSLLLPRATGDGLARELLDAIGELGDRFSLRVVGGDTNLWDGPLVINIAVLGRSTERGPLRRDGAQVGDIVLVTGSLGGSRLGKHLDFTPRVDEALHLMRNYRLTAGMDISDGLLLDLSRLVHDSGCGAVVDLSAVPVSEAAVRWSQRCADGRTALEHACSDGEDFELLLTAPPATAEMLMADQPLATGIHAIGHTIATGGLWAEGPQGHVPLEASGFDHLRTGR